MSAKITLITAVPGGGKSALMCSLADEWIQKGRKVYVHGLKNPNFLHEVLADAREWHMPGVVDDGALVLIDEVQEVWRPAANGARVPPDIAALEKHRHRGISFILTTQGPHLLHSNVKALVGQHIHLRNVGVLGRRYYEWSEIADPKRFATAPISKAFKLPKKAFSLYTSASMHVKTPHTIPPALLVVGFGVLAVGALSWYAYKSVSGKAAPVKIDAAATPSLQPFAAPSLGAHGGPKHLGVTKAVKLREPYANVGLHLAGSYAVGAVVRSWYTVTVDGRAVTTLQESSLLKAGYAVVHVAPCSVVLVFGELERVVICDAPAVSPGRVVAPVLAAEPLAVPAGESKRATALLS